jgi:diaminopimelate epimerase
MIQYEKYHGTGNDFVVVDADDYVPDRRAFARAVCDRAEGVGADGVLFLALEEQFTPPRVVMTLVQPDGSTAAMCGNGARCVAHWAARRTGSDWVMIDTLAGTREARVEDDRVTIEMGRPVFDPGEVPVVADDPFVREEIAGYEFTAVNTGVPHAVAFVDDVADVDLDSVGPEVRNATAFPDGANVTLASRTDAGFDQRTYERGVEDETRSCGTGAVAIAAVAARLGLADGDDPIAVSPPGGTLEVRLADRRTTLRGPVVREFEGRLDPIPGSTLGQEVPEA